MRLEFLFSEGGFDVAKGLEVLTNYMDNLKSNWAYFRKCHKPSELEVSTIVNKASLYYYTFLSLFYKSFHAVPWRESIVVYFTLCYAQGMNVL
jgi:hypothetical protein